MSGATPSRSCAEPQSHVSAEGESGEQQPRGPASAQRTARGRRRGVLGLAAAVVVSCRRCAPTPLKLKRAVGNARIRAGRAPAS